jgi:hypothetical protein
MNPTPTPAEIATVQGKLNQAVELVKGSKLFFIAMHDSSGARTLDAIANLIAEMSARAAASGAAAG